ncbi:MAG: hypothetical protein QM770_11710 [Tepidisphaeraceae bacterium]
MSNNERQRRFRARNPGYNNRYRNRGLGPAGPALIVPIDANSMLPSDPPIAAAEATAPVEGWLPAGC